MKFFVTVWLDEILARSARSLPFLGKYCPNRRIQRIPTLSSGSCHKCLHRPEPRERGVGKRAPRVRTASKQDSHPSWTVIGKKCQPPRPFRCDKPLANKTNTRSQRERTTMRLQILPFLRSVLNFEDLYLSSRSSNPSTKQINENASLWLIHFASYLKNRSFIRWIIDTQRRSRIFEIGFLALSLASISKPKSALSFKFQIYRILRSVSFPFCSLDWCLDR